MWPEMKWQAPCNPGHACGFLKCYVFSEACVQPFLSCPASRRGSEGGLLRACYTGWHQIQDLRSEACSGVCPALILGSAEKIKCCLASPNRPSKKVPEDCWCANLATPGSVSTPRFRLAPVSFTATPLPRESKQACTASFRIQGPSSHGAKDPERQTSTPKTAAPKSSCRRCKKGRLTTHNKITVVCSWIKKPGGAF